MLSRWAVDSPVVNAVHHQHHRFPVADHPHEAAFPHGQVDARGAVCHTDRGEAKPESTGAVADGAPAKVFPRELLTPIDGAGDLESVGGALPQKAARAGTVISHTGAIRKKGVSWSQRGRILWN